MATARRWVLPFLAAMTHHCRNRELTVRMAAAFDLDAEHVAFVTGSGRDTDKVQSIVAEATERREAEAVEHSGGAFEGTASDDRGLAAFTTDEEADDEDREADPDEAAEDDSQSGLSDFL
jgi:replication factor C large subunit